MLDQRAAFQEVTSLDVRHIVRDGPIEAVVRRRVRRRPADRREAAHIDDADFVLAGDEREIRDLQEVRQLFEAETAVGEARGVEQCRRQDPLVFRREELVARDRIR